MIAALERRMRMWMLICSFLLVSAIANAEMARYEIDPEHTTIGFRAVHMLVSNVQGQFMVFPGFIEMDPEARIVNTVEATIKTWSINTIITNGTLTCAVRTFSTSTNIRP